ncbi:hypothetical protein HK104_003797 [Borealophlyctis nickersoniae]|nr:hypothetical protein HK104_003797 [Borealophlyctis nickersoniae]
MSMMSGGTGESIVPTHTFANTPKLDILIVPGGMGTRTQANNTALTNFIRDRMGEVEYLLTVCTGSALAARSGVLDGKKATGTKFSWKWITQQSDKVQWVPQARWVEDGKILSSSGVTASLDMIYYFMSKLYGEKLARRMTNIIEYMPNTDPTWDPFAEIWGVVNNTAKSGTGNGSSNAAAALANPIGAGGSLGMWIAALAVLAVAVF